MRIPAAICLGLALLLGGCGDSDDDDDDRQGGISQRLSDRILSFLEQAVRTRQSQPQTPVRQ